MIQWLTIEGKDLGWFERSPYVQYGVVFFLIFMFQCWMLTTEHLQAVCAVVCCCEIMREKREGSAPPYICGGLGYNA
jgi:hypothetical protein